MQNYYVENPYSIFQSKRDIILTVTTSGIASLLLPGGRMTHSNFKILVSTLDNSTCKIDRKNKHTELMRQTKLIIWDEASMAHKYTFETLDHTLRDVIGETSNSTSIFGDKVIVFGGDFCQILHVIPHGSQLDIVHASLNLYYIWDHCEVLTLSKNMRLHNGSLSSNAEKAEQFSKWILKLGRGKLFEPNDRNSKIEIFPELLIPRSDQPIVAAIVQSTYPDLLHNYMNANILEARAILASTIERVDEINEYVLRLISGISLLYNLFHIYF